MCALTAPPPEKLTAAERSTDADTTMDEVKRG